ncbi:MAG: hypothetical protein WD894_26055 [Pirellulales bacterium]
MPLLADFVFRLAFGLALAMGLTSPARVTSGYFRNHLYVLLGLNVIATLAALADHERFLVWPALTAAVLSYFGAVAWLYEKSRLGIAALFLVAALDLAGSWLNHSPASNLTPLGATLHALDPVTGGLLLGSTMAAMFLGHWYLNTPTMELAPLRRLLKLMVGSLTLRIAASGVGLTGLVAGGQLASLNLPLLALRWLAGLAAMVVVIWMTWQTLKIPNTQSATGILYVGVILTFLGELVSLLLSRASPFPV